MQNDSWVDDPRRVHCRPQRDPLTLVATVATVLVATAAASYLPARSASRLDPMVTLKQD